MDINRLNEFVILADCLNYSRAANMLYLTQPVLSRHIHDLEQTLGAQLFVRDTHKVELSPIGAFAATEFRGVIDSYNTALKNIKSATDDVNSNISVGMLGAAVKPFITQFISFLSTHHPKIHVEYTASELDPLVEALKNGDLDIAFITHVSPDSLKEMNTRHITDDKLFIVLPPGHALSNREDLTLEEIAGLPIIAFQQDTNPYATGFHREIFSKIGAEMNIVRQVPNVDSGLFYTTLGEGCFIIPQHLLQLTGNLVTLPISNEDAVISLHLVWRKDNSKSAVDVFVNDFTAFYQNEYLH